MTSNHLVPIAACMSTPPANSSDSDVVLSVRAGEIDRFAELVDRYQEPLLRVAFSRVGHYGMAEDVVQEAFICAYRSLHSYDSRYSFRTWLWTILINLCKRHYARHKRREVVEQGTDYVQAAEETASPELNPEERALIRERSEWLERLIRNLPEVQADALRLRFFGALKFQEIADAMGCSLSSAKNRVRWGLEKLAGQIELADPSTISTARPHDS